MLPELLTVWYENLNTSHCCGQVGQSNIVNLSSGAHAAEAVGRTVRCWLMVLRAAVVGNYCLLANVTSRAAACLYNSLPSRTKVYGAFKPALLCSFAVQQQKDSFNCVVHTIWYGAALTCQAGQNMGALVNDLHGESAMLALEHGLCPVTTVLQPSAGCDGT